MTIAERERYESAYQQILKNYYMNILDVDSGDLDAAYDAFIMIFEDYYLAKLPRPVAVTKTIHLLADECGLDAPRDLVISIFDTWDNLSIKEESVMVRSLKEAKVKNFNQTILEYILKDKIGKSIINGSKELAKFLCAEENDFRPFLDQYFEELLKGNYVDITMIDDEVEEMYLILMDGFEVKGFIGDRDVDGEFDEYLDKLLSKNKGFRILKDEDNIDAYFVLLTNAPKARR